KLLAKLLCCLLLSIFILPLRASLQLLSVYTDDKPYNKVCWLTTHNAFANLEDGWGLYNQQTIGFNAQYQLGVRSFMLDLHWYQPASGDAYIALCHEDPIPKDASCPETYIFRGFQGNPVSLEKYFQQIKIWLETNQEDVITLHFESYLGAKGGKALKELLEKPQLKLDKYLYKPCEAFPEEDFFAIHHGRRLAKRWPTLGQMRKADTRLVIFSSNLGDEMLSVDNYHETAYDLAYAPNCEKRKDRRVLAPKNGQLFLINHFHKYSFTIPFFTTNYQSINSFSAIMKRVEECYFQFKKWPNFIAVDFVEEGLESGPKAAVFKVNTEKFVTSDSTLSHDEL
ncbi:MAG: hypothetical protein Q8T08_21590, partial [Ignavibacteria bacterium]|nr:hypothetical protein [Ignavibacteria bacterium]